MNFQNHLIAFLFNKNHFSQVKREYQLPIRILLSRLAGSGEINSDGFLITFQINYG
jgi:hypothetical protein